ncbi:MAG: hypothetical protein QOK23_2684 [Gammaproteobacteria bacterium]|jgi:hypothetical protein|nr:hypothetical protein [Gammaproteobacteria bacterium]
MTKRRNELRRSHLKERSVTPEKMQSRSQPHGIDVAAKKAIRKILAPIADFALNCGLSVNDVNSIFEQAAVRNVAARQVAYARRVNVSGISATTGLSRAEISKVLEHAWSPNDPMGVRSQKVTNRILSAWHSDPRFLTANGRPTSIKLYGRGTTFESLVKTYGRGIPIRAILDELLRIEAIELKSGQKISPRSFTAVDRRIAPRNISAVGDSVSNFLSSTLRSFGTFDSPVVINRVAAMKLSASEAVLVRTAASAKARTLLDELRQMLIRKQGGSRGSNPSSWVQLGITMVFTEKLPKRALKESKKRRNFRRGQ